MIAASVAAAEPAVRLAATLTQTGYRAALLDFDGEQTWLRPGQSLRHCRLDDVQPASVVLDCGTGRRVLPLAPGSGTAPVPAPAVERVELPPGRLQILATRPQAIALGLDLSPEAEQGRVQGWRITRLDAASELNELGLRESDLVISVAGIPASEPGSFAAAVRRLPGEGAFTLEILRQERRVSLHVIAPPH